MAALWDILGRAANLAQLFGLDTVTLITVSMSFLRLHEVKKACRKLEERERMLRVLLCSPAGYWIMQQQQQQQHSELGDLMSKALEDAYHLCECYKESSLFFRVRRGRSMVRQFRDMRNCIDSHCGLILSINACLLFVEDNPPPSVFRTDVNDGSVPPAIGYSIDPETSTAAPHDTHITIAVS